MVKYVSLKEYSNVVIEDGFFTESSLDLAIKSNNRPLILDNSIFLTEELIADCMGDENLIREAVMLEGAKFDVKLRNFLQEGEDYKGIKKDIREILKAQGMSEEDFIKKGVWRKILHILKRFVQIVADLYTLIGVPLGVGVDAYHASLGVAAGKAAVAATGGTVATPVAVIIAILIVAIFAALRYFGSRAIRWLADTAELSRAKKDMKEIAKIARQNADSCENPAGRKKFNSIANQLEKKIDRMN